MKYITYIFNIYWYLHNLLKLIFFSNAFQILLHANMWLWATKLLLGFALSPARKQASQVNRKEITKCRFHVVWFSTPFQQSVTFCLSKRLRSRGVIPEFQTGWAGGPARYVPSRPRTGTSGTPSLNGRAALR